MTLFDQEHEPPEPGPGDVAHQIADAFASMVPGGSQLLNLVLAPPLERRRDQWMRDVATVLRELTEQRGMTPEDLASNAVFIDLIAQASAAAVKTSVAAKLEALRNALRNGPIASAPDADLQRMFVALIDSFGEWHLRVLKLFSEQRLFANRVAGAPAAAGQQSLRHHVEGWFPELQGHPEFSRAVYRDLQAAGLVHLPVDYIAPTFNSQPGHSLGKWTTGLGDQFLRFIAPPDGES